MPFQNMPAALSEIFQSNMLDRAFQEQLSAINVYRKSAYKRPMPVRSGEVMIYSRAGRISPSLQDLNPSSNLPLDNGLTPGGLNNGNPPPFPFEQFLVSIGMLPSQPIDLNLIQNQEIIADLFKQNMDNLAENAGLSLDLRAASVGFRAYESGRSFATAPGTPGSPSTVHVDNVYGLDAAFLSGVFANGATFSYGSPLPVSTLNPLLATWIDSSAVSHTIHIVGVTLDGSNTSTMAANGLNVGFSGTLSIQESVTIGANETIIAFDGASIFRPNGKLNRSLLTASDTIGAQLIINAVAELRRNGVKPPLGNGTYPCYIDPVVDAQFFTDPQYQIMSQGQLESPDFRGARVSQNFGVTFVPTTNSPSYVFQNSVGATLTARRAIVCGEKWLQESTFDGTKAALKAMPDMGVADYRYVDDIVFVNRLPLDRAGQIMSSMFYWIGGFVAPTNATITSAVIPTATSARYKSACVIEVASGS
jgi:hypothetical protein